MRAHGQPLRVASRQAAVFRHYRRALVATSLYNAEPLFEEREVVYTIGELDNRRLTHRSTGLKDARLGRVLALRGRSRLAGSGLHPSTRDLEALNFTRISRSHARHGPHGILRRAPGR